MRFLRFKLTVFTVYYFVFNLRFLQKMLTEKVMSVRPNSLCFSVCFFLRLDGPVICTVKYGQTIVSDIDERKQGHTSRFVQFYSVV